MLEIIPGATAAVADLVIKHDAETTNQIINADKVHHNYGFAKNLLDDKPRLVRAVSVLFTIWLTAVFLISFTFAGAKSLRMGLGMLLGGAFSNTYDRVARGYVVDYIRIPFAPRPLRRLIWNIADFALIIGAFITALSS